MSSTRSFQLTDFEKGRRAERTEIIEMIRLWQLRHYGFDHNLELIELLRAKGGEDPDVICWNDLDLIGLDRPVPPPSRKLGSKPKETAPVTYGPRYLARPEEEDLQDK